MKRKLLSVLMVVVLTLTTFVGCGLVTSDVTETAAAVYTMDVNPGLRIFVNKDGGVIGVEATNDDGEKIAASITYEGENFETVTEQIVDVLEAEGYLVSEECSILLTLEKSEIEIVDGIKEKIDKALDKHGKSALIIEQELDRLDEKLDKKLDEISEKHHVSKGKARLIEMISSEFPELSYEELAKLSIQELRMLLEDVSEEAKGHFDRLDKISEEGYTSREQAIIIALAALNIDITSPEGIPMVRLRATRRDGKMTYLAQIIYGELKYEIVIDARTGEILSNESEEYVEFNPEDALNEFFDRHGVDANSLKEHFCPDKNGEERLSRAELIGLAIEKLGIDAESVAKSDFHLHTSREDVVCRIEIILDDGSEYSLVLEAFSGEIIKAELNGEQISEPVENDGE